MIGLVGTRGTFTQGKLRCITFWRSLLGETACGSSMVLHGGTGRALCIRTYVTFIHI